MAPKCYIPHLIFQYAHSLIISAQTDQNCQSCLISKNGIGRGQKGVNATMAPKLLHSLFCFSLCAFSENFSPNGPEMPRSLTSKNGLGVAKGGGLMPYMAPKMLHSPFRFSICTFSENFSPNGPNCQSSLESKNSTGHGQKQVNALYGSKIITFPISFIITHIL